MRKFLAAAGSAVLIGLAAGCSSSASVINHPVGASGGAVAHVGATLDLKNQAGRDFHISLTKLVDPAQAVNQGSPSNDKRFIAAEFDLTNTSSAALSTNADLDANLIGSDGNVYTPKKTALSECGSNTVKVSLAAGKSGTTCVAFEVKTTVNVSKVQFYPAAGTASDYGEWLVP